MQVPPTKLTVLVLPTLALSALPTWVSTCPIGLPMVELELAVSRESDRSLLLQKVYRDEQPAAGASVAQAVDAASAAVSAIFARFLADAQAQALR